MERTQVENITPTLDAKTASAAQLKNAITKGENVNLGEIKIGQSKQIFIQPEREQKETVTTYKKLAVSREVVGGRKNVVKPLEGSMANYHKSIDMKPEKKVVEKPLVPFKTAVKESVEEIEAVQKQMATKSIPYNETLEHIDPKNPPASLYLTIKGKPLVSEYFGLKQLYGQFETEIQSKEIESFIIDQMKKEHLIDDKESYFTKLQQIETALKLTEQHDLFYRLKKVHQYVNLMQREREVNRLKRRLLGE